MYDKRYSCKKLKQKLHYWEEKRDKARKERGVSPYQKGILDSYPELRDVNDEINVIRASLRSLKNTIEHLKDRIARLKQEQKLVEEQKNKAWGKYMVKCRRLHRFYHLFRLTGQEFQVARKKIVSHLHKESAKGCELSEEILRILTEVKSLATWNMENCPIWLNLNFINTNAIESINSRVRPYLECLRKITDSRYIRTYLESL